MIYSTSLLISKIYLFYQFLSVKYLVIIVDLSVSPCKWFFPFLLDAFYYGITFIEHINLTYTVWCIFMRIYPHNPNQDREQFQHLRLPHVLSSQYAAPLSITTIVTWGWQPIPEMHANAIIQYLVLCVCLLLLNIMSMSFIHVVTHSSSLFFWLLFKIAL